MGAIVGAGLHAVGVGPTSSTGVEASSDGKPALRNSWDRCRSVISPDVARLERRDDGGRVVAVILEETRCFQFFFFFFGRVGMSPLIGRGAEAARVLGGWTAPDRRPRETDSALCAACPDPRDWDRGGRVALRAVMT